MKTDLKTLAAAAALLLGAAAPALADSQLIANAGLSADAAQDLSLTDIAAAKFSRNAGHDNYQATVTPGSGGDASQLAASAGIAPSEAGSLSLTEVAVAKFNRNADHDDRQSAVRGDGVTVISRSAESGAWSQLAAAAGLTPEEARGMSLTELAVAKFNRNADHDDRQGS